MQTIDFRAMGCRMMAALDSDAPNNADALQGVAAWFEEWEAILSRFREDSELTRLNQSGGQSVRVSMVLWEVLKEALEAARRSQGLVVPHLLNALEAAGYDRSFERIRESGATSDPVLVMPMTTAEATEGWRAIELNSRTHSVRLPPGARLDFGGIAKGWAADRALQRLGVRGPALVDAGGDIAVGAAPQGQTGWLVAIGDPLNNDEPLAMLCLANLGVATSGRDYRKWQAGGSSQHHILDPRTGNPADTDVLTATVIAPSASLAETAAKTVLILGSEAGIRWLDAQEDLAGLVVLEDGTTIQSSRLDRYLCK